MLIHRSIDILTLSQIQKGLRWERLSIDIVVQRLMDAALTMTQTNVSSVLYLFLFVFVIVTGCWLMGALVGAKQP